MYTLHTLANFGYCSVFNPFDSIATCYTVYGIYIYIYVYVCIICSCVILKLEEQVLKPDIRRISLITTGCKQHLYIYLRVYTREYMYVHEPTFCWLGLSKLLQ